ncbi:MAG: L-ribulose-5-phosphate 4-epimerase AraD [Actinobacteria bacterium]|nr:L-ribulose-5-phosphate 4-epimerase AraD [Actinomycetota bacterium]
MKDKDIIKLKEQVYDANMALVRHKLVIFTFGNVSAIDRQKDVIAIKPSGVDYEKLKPQDMVLIDMDGNKLEEGLNPSSDTKTHIELYRAFENIRGVAHTHSRYATVFAQAILPIKCLGTTHADYFYGDIPCTEPITDSSIEGDYEKETGVLIIKTFKSLGLDYSHIKACLVGCHGSFTWGDSADDAVFASAILEEIAMQNLYTQLINPSVKSIKNTILDKHYKRKHGKDAYYGQKRSIYRAK